MFNKSYYDDRKKDMTDALQKEVARLVENVYSFVREREASMQKYNELLQKEQASLKEDAVKEVKKNIKK